MSELIFWMVVLFLLLGGAIGYGIAKDKMEFESRWAKDNKNFDDMEG